MRYIKIPKDTLASIHFTIHNSSILVFQRHERFTVDWWFMETDIQWYNTTIGLYYPNRPAIIIQIALAQLQLTDAEIWLPNKGIRPFLKKLDNVFATYD